MSGKKESVNEAVRNERYTRPYAKPDLIKFRLEMKIWNIYLLRDIGLKNTFGC